jgi:hypothetical protein
MTEHLLKQSLQSSNESIITPRFESISIVHPSLYHNVRLSLYQRVKKIKKGIRFNNYKIARFQVQGSEGKRCAKSCSKYLTIRKTSRIYLNLISMNISHSIYIYL